MPIAVSLLFGLVVGAVARLIVPVKEPGGWIFSMLIGVAGSLLAGFAGRTLGLYRNGEPVGFLVSVLGAIAFVVGGQLAARRRRNA